MTDSNNNSVIFNEDFISDFVQDNKFVNISTESINNYENKEYFNNYTL